jgi:hypothetical protein
MVSEFVKGYLRESIESGVGDLILSKKIVIVAIVFGKKSTQM